MNKDAKTNGNGAHSSNLEWYLWTVRIVPENQIHFKSSYVMTIFWFSFYASTGWWMLKHVWNYMLCVFSWITYRISFFLWKCKVHLMDHLSIWKLVTKNHDMIPSFSKMCSFPWKPLYKLYSIVHPCDSPLKMTFSLIFRNYNNTTYPGTHRSRGTPDQWRLIKQLFFPFELLLVQILLLIFHDW